MTTPATPPVPLQPLYFSGDSMLGVDGAPRERPGMLTAVCVIAIVLGVMGLGKSLFGLGGLALKKTLENAFKMPPQPGMREGFVEAQADMQKEMQAVTDRYWGVNVGLASLNLAFSASLLVGGIMTLRLNPTARTFLIAVFAAVIVFEIVHTVVTVFIQLEVAAVTSDAMPRMMAAAGPKGGPPPEQFTTVMATFTKVLTFVIIAFCSALGLAEVVFYGVGACYLRRPNIRQLFQQTTTDQM